MPAQRLLGTAASDRCCCWRLLRVCCVAQYPWRNLGKDPVEHLRQDPAECRIAPHTANVLQTLRRLKLVPRDPKRDWPSRSTEEVADGLAGDRLGRDPYDAVTVALP